MNTTQTDQAVAASGNPSVRSAQQAPSQLAGFRHLLWKEYRSIRLFWISMLALTVAIQLLILAFSQDKNETVLMIYHFALGAPAFFAVGAAGAAFAAEKEEGTFDFLRASPISAGQIVASKLLFVFFSTAALLAVVWPVAIYLSGHQFPDANNLTGMLGLWLVGALEAIAWGTLFSLLGARPLVAIILAMVLATTCAHALSRFYFERATDSFELGANASAVLSRTVLALVVLAADLWLGFRWLDVAAHDSKPKSLGRRSLLRRGQGGGDSLPPSSLAPALREVDTQGNSELQHLLRKRSRFAMLARLVWQHWRQSWRFLLLVPVLCGFGMSAIGVAGLTGILRRDNEFSIPLCMALIASLIGSMVFLPDQEQRRYRSFAEHNVPPRYIWLTRNLFWMIVLSFPIVFALGVWLMSSDARELWRIIMDSTVDSGSWMNLNYHAFVRWPPMVTCLLMVAVAYAAAQWVSMLIRSGIMSGFFGILLSAALCGWTILMHQMQISLTWSVLPIPFVLLFATWLRAPDWISENKRTRARLKVAAVALLPALAILIAVPIHRVHQVPETSPGFDVQEFRDHIDAIWPDAHETAELYRKAADQIKALGREPDSEHSTAAEREQWFADIEQPIQLIIEASNRPNCLFVNPFTEQSLPVYDARPIWLLRGSAEHLQSNGQLDAALDRYLIALRVADQLSQCFSGVSDRWEVHFVLDDIAKWSGESGQTPERLRGALERLKEFNHDSLHFDDQLKSVYVITARALAGDKNALDMFYAMSIPGERGQETQRQKLIDSNITYQRLWAILMPWENARAKRVLNQLSQGMLWRLSATQQMLALQGQKQHDAGNALQGVSSFQGWLTHLWYPSSPGVFPKDSIDGRLYSWLQTTFPSLHYIDSLGDPGCAQYDRDRRTSPRDYDYFGATSLPLRARKTSNFACRASTRIFRSLAAGPLFRFRIQIFSRGRQHRLDPLRRSRKLRKSRA